MGIMHGWGSCEPGSSPGTPKKWAFYCLESRKKHVDNVFFSVAPVFKIIPKKFRWVSSRYNRSYNKFGLPKIK